MCIPPDSFREMANELMAYLPTFDAFDIHVGFDCGMPMCIFTDEEIDAYREPKEGKITDLVKLLSLLHSKTTFYKEIDLINTNYNITIDKTNDGNKSFICSKYE